MADEEQVNGTQLNESKLMKSRSLIEFFFVLCILDTSHSSKGAARLDSIEFG